MRDSEVSETPVTKMMVYSNMKIGVGNVGMNNLLGNMSMQDVGKKYTHYPSIVTEAVKKRQ